tara:strand:+ start:711 stop:911 length:201 start_codon:yes stop_codon:yes gene_type:complete
LLGVIKFHLKQLKEYMVCESEVIKIMKKNLKPKSFKIWRESITGRTRKHEKRRNFSSRPFKLEDYV